jgi:2-oxo-4-hydroxy-4-carboxy-5-ureidoimidazoline decarboxylase
MLTVDELNKLPVDAVRQALNGCCSSGRWIDALAARRPFAGAAALLAASDAAVAGLSEADLRDALAGHPRIGDRRVVAEREGSSRLAGTERGGSAGSSPQAKTATGWSGQEQAGVRDAGAGLRQALDEGNAEYERRFGHIYLACATGRSASELLAFLRERLGNDQETEWGVVASELAKINQIRLRKLIGDGS